MSGRGPCQDPVRTGRAGRGDSTPQAARSTPISQTALPTLQAARGFDSPRPSNRSPHPSIRTQPQPRFTPITAIGFASAQSCLIPPPRLVSSPSSAGRRCPRLSVTLACWRVREGQARG